MSRNTDISLLHFYAKLSIIRIAKRGIIVHISVNGGFRMLNFEKELEKFQPSMDIEQVEDVVYNNNLADITDIVKELIQDSKGTL